MKRRMFFGVALLLFACGVQAALTSAQMATLKAAIIADSVLNAYPNTSDGNFALCAEKLNVVASPAYVVWDSEVTPAEWSVGVLAGATQIDALTQGKRDELFWIVKDTRNAGDVAVRNAIDDATGSQNTLKNALIAAMKRNALLVEKILAVGVGTTASPAVLGWSGPVDYQDVMQARGM